MRDVCSSSFDGMSSGGLGVLLVYVWRCVWVLWFTLAQLNGAIRTDSKILLGPRFFLQAQDPSPPKQGRLLHPFEAFSSKALPKGP